MELTNTQLNELVRCYPFIRIPTFKYADYYIGKLKRALPWKDIDRIIELLIDCDAKHGDTGRYRMKEVFPMLLSHFNYNLKHFNSFDVPKTSWTKKEFVSENNKIYYSIDLKEGNWSVFNKVCDISPLCWKDYVKTKFDIHDFISESKSFRQYVFGNLNPGRIASFQKVYVAELVKIVEQKGGVIMGISTDEVIFTYHEDPEMFEYELPLNFSSFHMSSFSHLGDTIKIKTTRSLHNNNVKKELFGVNGNRFYLHLSPFILNEDIRNEDKIFEPEPGKWATWII